MTEDDPDIARASLVGQDTTAAGATPCQGVARDASAIFARGEISKLSSALFPGRLQTSCGKVLGGSKSRIYI
jgi:hypothetical protein